MITTETIRLIRDGEKGAIEVGEREEDVSKKVNMVFNFHRNHKA